MNNSLEDSGLRGKYICTRGVGKEKASAVCDDAIPFDMQLHQAPDSLLAPHACGKHKKNI